MIARTFLAALIFLFAQHAVLAQERILRFVSEVEVQQNGDLFVTETIVVQAQGREIRRGILRDFPTTYTARDGRRVVVGFDVLSVTRNGRPEPYTTTGFANGVRIRIGSVSVILQRGPQAYVIRYRTTRQIGFFPDFDELYWNVTGTGWTFAIESAETRILLPDGAQIRRSAFYTGPQGSSGKDAEVVTQSENEIFFRTTRMLPRNHGLTVAVAWQKGIVAPPTRTQRAGYFLRDNLALTISFGGLLLIALYYFVQWLRVGRDPPGGLIVPMFGPPANMSAADVRYLDQRTFDDKAFAAAVIELGVKGHLTLKDEGGKTRVTQRDGGKPLTASEEAVKKRFLGSKGSFELEKKNHARIGGARTALKDFLEKSYYGKLFANNGGLWGWGFLWTILAVVAGAFGIGFAFNSDYAADVMLATLLPAIPILLGTFALQHGIQGRSYNRWLIGLGVLVAVIPAALGLYAVWYVAAGPVEMLPTIAIYATIVICALALDWLAAPSVEGRKLLDHIEGLREYLGTAEEERLEYLNPPQKTPELFEKLLPYALALDVENTWAKKFAGVLAAAAAAEATRQSIAHWYSGNEAFARDPVAFTSTLSGSLAQSIAASSSPPGTSGGSNYSSSSSSSSSGSSGGGSSGGGGGGGGGSGW